MLPVINKKPTISFFIYHRSHKEKESNKENYDQSDHNSPSVKNIGSL